MITNNYNERLNRLKGYLRIEDDCQFRCDACEWIKQVVVERLCQEMGVLIPINSRSEYFKIFSNVVGEAVSRVLKLNITVGHPVIRLIKYNSVNLVEKACEILVSEDVGEAFVDLYLLTENYKKYIPNF